MKNLDRKLAAVAAGRYTPDDFVIADAKDADTAFGVPAGGPLPGVPVGRTGPVGPGLYRTHPQYLEAMRALVAQAQIDVLLTSASTGERLAGDGTPAGTPITLAVRANDPTDGWNQRGATYPTAASRPFRSADLDCVRAFCDLVLYSVTFTNDLDRDLSTLRAFAAFRQEAAPAGVRYFLAVVAPNAAGGLDPGDVAAFVNDSIVRVLAGVTAARRPLFVTVAYPGADALAELVEHDPSLVVGILGGSAGTTRDTYELLHRGQAHGARAALLGPTIQRAESQLDLVALMRPVLRGELSPADAVRAYHDALASDGVPPHRELAADLQVTDPVLVAE